MGKKKTSRIVELRRRLLDFYDGNRRELPWRGETDPYRVWVSEVMLQQTRVETVIPYYEKWVERFPNLETLADAEEDEVLRAWQGLGYYSRARRLQQGARVVRERLGGKLPTDSVGLKELPGVGEYTAGAVASIAFDEVVPAVDGNVRRVLARLHDLPDPSPSELRGLAGALVDPGRPGDFNQALMELGALVCTPRNPRCGGCPVSTQCAALARGTVQDRPAGKERAAVPEVDMAVLVLAARDQAGVEHFLLRKRPSEGLLAGMWEFPGVEVESEEAEGFSDQHRKKLAGPDAVGERVIMDFPAQLRQKIMDEYLRRGVGARVSMEAMPHTFTHLKIQYHPVLIELGGLSPKAEAALPSMAEGALQCTEETALPGWVGRGIQSPTGSRYRWVPVNDLRSFPLPVAQAKIAETAKEKLRT